MAAPAIPRINDVESSKENCGEVRRKRAGEAATATLTDRWVRLCQAPWRGAGVGASWSMARVNGRPLLSFDAAALSKRRSRILCIIEDFSRFFSFLFFSEIMAADFVGFRELIYLFEMGLQMI